ncbi:MAG: hypothetical protein R3F59_07135 [Myxococcota bacterium]
MDMFDVDWTDELLSDAREVVLEILAEDATGDEPDLDALAHSVRAHRERVHRNARPMTDLDLADTLCEATLGLLHRAADWSPDQRRLASVAARYYVSPRQDDDLGSPFGFDDDVEVFNAIAARIAPELVLAG